MKQGTLGIVSFHDDPHARVVRGIVRQKFARACEIVAVDRLAASAALHWQLGHAEGARLPTVHGAPLRLADLSTLWWRRAGAPSEVPDTVIDEAAIGQISDDCACALGSLMRAEFHGAWVSHPDATRLAELKILQLKAARKAGLRVPETLVSQDADAIRAFAAAHSGRVIAKPLTTRLGSGVAAGTVSAAMLADSQALQLSPAIYQERIAGTRHLRVHVLGERVLAAAIDAPDLDWRFNLKQALIEAVEIEPGLARRLVDVLHLLGLRMGVFDIKLDEAGEPVWLEVNPQGQYLFIEALSGLPLSEAVAEFLVDEDRRTSGRPPAPRQAAAAQACMP